MRQMEVRTESYCENKEVQKKDNRVCVVNRILELLCYCWSLVVNVYLSVQDGVRLKWFFEKKQHLGQKWNKLPLEQKTYILFAKKYMTIGHFFACLTYALFIICLPSSFSEK